MMTPDLSDTSIRQNSGIRKVTNTGIILVTTAEREGAVNLSHWANRQANGLFAHPRSNVID